MSALTRAAKALSLAQTYAEDGAVVSAIEYGTEAMALLFAERDRRMKIGLIPAFPGASTAPASRKMVTGPGPTFAKPRPHSAATRRKMAAAAKARNK
ncbi:MAG: hypothetical protein IVW54_16640 [Candidatus Binataceae bacterium]|nr:hypothetical protein [Candidatus Binataceae bacterium]